MGFKDFTVDTTNPEDLVENKVIKIDGKKYKIIKKVGKKVAVTRYFWFDSVWDKLAK